MSQNDPHPSMKNCKFFQSDSGCMRGQNCRFSHNTNTNNYIPEAQKHRCKFFLSSAGCRHGAACRFSHQTAPFPNHLPPQPALPLTQPPLPPFPPPPPQNGGGYFTPMQPPLPPPTKTTIPFQPLSTRDLTPPFYGIDVECIASGTGFSDRKVARIAVVDEDENTLFDRFVKPDGEIVSCLTPLTGIVMSDLEDASDLKTVLLELKTKISPNGCIIGQSIHKDLEWLGFEESVDYASSFDIAHLFRIPFYSGPHIKYRNFSLRHVAKYLMDENIQEAEHDPVIDAKFALKIFKRFRHLRESPAHFDAVKQTLLKTPRTPSFAEKFPVIDGVQLSAPTESRRNTELEITKELN